MSLDSSIFNFLHNLAGQYSFLGWLFRFCSDDLIYVLAAVFVLYILSNFKSRRRIYLFSLGILSVVVSRGLIAEFIKYFYNRARPILELGLSSSGEALTSSFPSGHMAVLVPLTLLVWHENKKVGKWFIFGTILVGIGRIATAWHWPTDILAGIAVGAISFYLVRKFLPKA